MPVIAAFPTLAPDRPAASSAPRRPALPAPARDAATARSARPPWRTVDTIALLRRLAGAPRTGTGLTLWLLLLTEQGAPTGLTIPVPDLPRTPDPWVASGVLHALVAQAAASPREVHVAVGYARSDGGTRSAVEVGWSRALHRAAAEMRVKIVTEIALGRRRTSVLSTERPASRAA